MRQSVGRRKWYIRLVTAVVVVVLLYLWISLRPPLWYYTQITGAPHELPTRLVGPAFRWITEKDLPSKTEKLRAIFHGGRDPSIFVRFQTDSDGILYTREQLTPAGAEYEPFTGTPGFHIVSQWQERFGIGIYDGRAIESGLRLRDNRVSGVSFEIVIDAQHNDLCIYAVRR